MQFILNVNNPFIIDLPFFSYQVVCKENELLKFLFLKSGPRRKKTSSSKPLALQPVIYLKGTWFFFVSPLHSQTTTSFDLKYRNVTLASKKCNAILAVRSGTKGLGPGPPE